MIPFPRRVAVLFLPPLLVASLAWTLWPSARPAGAAADASADAWWPQWRGPRATGAAPLADPPVTWSETDNVRWKVPIPGRGHATPAVWGDRVYVLTAVPVDGPPAAPSPEEAGSRGRRGVAPDAVLEFTVLALDRADGRVVWQRVARRARPHEGTHTDGSWSSGSPITDGQHLFAHFGSQGLYAYDLDGKLLWSRDFGDMTARLGFGEGSTPFLFGDRIVVLWDHEGDSFLVVVDKRTGEDLWRRERDEQTTWSTPVVVEVNGRPQIVVNATNAMRGYDLETGKDVWESTGMTVNAIPSPVVADGVAYFLSGFRGAFAVAVRLADARGRLGADNDAILWTHDRDTPYVPSPLLYGGRLYFLKGNSAVLSCFDAASGQPHYGPLRLEGVEGVYASPVGAAGRVYVAGRNGAVDVFGGGDRYQRLALNELDDSFDASPVAVGGELFLRGRNLYCLARDGS